MSRPYKTIRSLNFEFLVNTLNPKYKWCVPISSSVSASEVIEVDSICNLNLKKYAHGTVLLVNGKKYKVGKMFELLAYVRDNDLHLSVLASMLYKPKHEETKFRFRLRKILDLGILVIGRDGKVKIGADWHRKQTNTLKRSFEFFMTGR